MDQKRVDKLPCKKFHRLYDSKMWKRNREDHVAAIVELVATVDEMPERLLRDLSKLACVYKPEVVKQPLLDAISDLATGARSPWLYELASLFFRELIKAVRQRRPGISTTGSPGKMMLKWLDYDDPIKISEDPECQYTDLMASHIKREFKKAREVLAAQSRIAFIEMLVAKEFCDCWLPQSGKSKKL